MTRTSVSPYDETSPGDEAKAARLAGAELAPGARVGRYEVLRVLGRGGMGAVYAAHDPQLERQVAVKLLHPDKRTRPELLVAEARALARLDDPNVVQVFDVGEHDGEIFIAMQLFVGEDLRSALATRHPRAPRILAWFVAAGRGLAAAHAAGLVHRDFKPSNVLVDRRGRVAVTDFGLAISVHTDVAGERVAGTPLYMAPEQFAQGTATVASDQFAFCTALWEALFGQHPYVDRRAATSTIAEIGEQISRNKLVAPSKSAGVSARVIAALTRGLARDPAARWPSMEALLVELAPPPRRPLWPAAALGLAIAATASGALWIAQRDDEPSCEVTARRRLASAWSPARAAVQRVAFAHAPRQHAAQAAAEIATTLDRYAARWSALATDVCAAERASAATPDLVVRQRACVAHALDRMRAVGEVFDVPTAETIDHAHDVLATLPTLSDCADPKVLLAGPDVPAPGVAWLVAALSKALDDVAARQSAGSAQTLDEARSLVQRAQAIGWGPSIARAHLALGSALAIQYQPALDELVRAAELAIANHLDREAVAAWSFAFGEAAYEGKPEIIQLLATEARSTASRTGDPALALNVEIARARALTQAERWQEGLAICRPAVVTAETLGDRRAIETARDCMFEALLPAGRMDELHAVAEERIASAAQRFGPDAPALAGYLLVLADVDARAGKLPAARAEIDRALAIVDHAFGDRPHRVRADALRTRASIEDAEGQADRAHATLREARDVAMAVVPRPAILLADIQTAIAVAYAQANDLPAATREFESAIATTRAYSAESTALAILLLNYGQIVGASDFDAGLRAFAEARQILERRHDPRASYAAMAMAVVESQRGLWQDARAHADDAVAFAAHDPDAIPANTAEIEFVLAQAIVQTHGDATRAVALARTARGRYAQLGPGLAPAIAAIDRWLARHR